MKKFVVNTLILLLSIPLPVVSSAQELASPKDDLVAPVLKHTNNETTAIMQAGHIFSATVTDEVGVATVTLFYRTTGAMTYERIIMNRLSHSDEFTAFVEPESMSTKGIEYYIQADDLAGNAVLRGYAFSPLKLAVTHGTPISGDTHLTQNADGDSPLFIDSSEDESNIWANKWIWTGLGAVLLGSVVIASDG